MRLILFLILIVSSGIAAYSFIMIKKKLSELKAYHVKAKELATKASIPKNYSEQYLTHEANGELDMLPSDVKELLDKTYLLIVYLDRRINQLSSENLAEFNKIKNKIFIETLELIATVYKNASSLSMQDQLTQLELSSNSLKLIFNKLTAIVDSLTEHNMQKLKVNDLYLQHKYTENQSIDS